MKKLLRLVFVAVLLVFLATPAFPLGTVTIVPTRIQVNNVITRVVLVISWVGDSANGSVPTTTINSSTYQIQGWYLYSAETKPGTPAPTDQYSIVINDSSSLDIAGSLITSRSTTNTELVNVGKASFGYPIVNSNLSFVLTGNSQTSAKGTLILTFLAN